MKNTVAAIQRELRSAVSSCATTPDKPGMACRPVKERSWPASFWLADNLALQQRREEAHALFEHLLSLRNDVGLLAEEYDPEAKRQLGNFPQASHTSGACWRNNRAWRRPKNLQPTAHRTGTT